MKLLSKREIDASKALERKLEVDEGRKLAEKVDMLRRLYAEEQAKFARFRDETIHAVLGEIRILIEERDSLRSKVRQLRTEADLPAEYRL